MGAAEAAKRDAAEAAAQVKAQLADAENEHLRVVEEARRTAEALRNEQLVRLREEVADTRARALEDIEASKTRAIQELHASLARLAVAAAEDTVRRALDDQTRVALVDQFIEELSTSGTGARA